MTVLKKKVNWKHLAVHGLAIWMLQKAGAQAGLLTDTELLNILADPSMAPDMHDGEILQRRFEMLIRMGYFSGGAILAGFLCSMFITLRQKWYWLNSLLAFLLVLLITWLMALSPIVGLMKGWLNLFQDLVLVEILFLTFFLVAALLLFFLPALQKWIRKDYMINAPEEFQFEALR